MISSTSMSERVKNQAAPQTSPPRDRTASASGEQTAAGRHHVVNQQDPLAV
jgi:hypothetical protein